jgi:superfamily II DNA helicase RecQ
MSRAPPPAFCPTGQGIAAVRRASPIKAGPLLELKDLLRKNADPSIVHVRTYDQTDNVCTNLKSSGSNAYGYHAGMTNDAGTLVQDEFMTSKDMVIATTIAFGTGDRQSRYQKYCSLCSSKDS